MSLFYLYCVFIMVNEDLMIWVSWDYYLFYLNIGEYFSLLKLPSLTQLTSRLGGGRGRGGQGCKCQFSALFFGWNHINDHRYIVYFIYFQLLTVMWGMACFFRLKLTSFLVFLCWLTWKFFYFSKFYSSATHKQCLYGYLIHNTSNNFT